MLRMALCLVVVVAGCDLPFGPARDLRLVGARDIAATDEMARQHANVSACLSQERPAEDIRWQLADTIQMDGTDLAGVWIPPNVIVLLNTVDQRPMRHELAHYILQAGDEIHLPGGRAPCDVWWHG